jgi:outer membrane protein assembly factor BamB
VLPDYGVLSAYVAKTGVNIYQQRLPTSFSASPVAADGKLYLSSEDGDVFVVKAGRQYELISRNTMGQALMATPALAPGMLIVRAEDAIYALGERKNVKNETQ